MKWLWSSRECGIFGIDDRFALLASFLAVSLISYASGATIQAGTDIQVAIDKAHIGDTIVVGLGQYSSFDVDRPVKIQGENWPVIQAAVQRPGITIRAEGAEVLGFKIKGAAKDDASKFDYYMQHPAAAALMLDLPNAGIIVERNDVVVKNIIIFGSQVGLYADGAVNISILNVTFDRCGMGAELLNCREGTIENSRSQGCDKSGIYIEHSSGIRLENNSVADTSNSGILLKASTNCIISNNTASGNKEGIALWNSSFIDIHSNRADRSYYGILLSGSNNNTVVDNTATDNSRSEIVKGFGIAISLQENSTYNIVARNVASKSLNGLELTRGCKYNVVYSNNATDNTHGIRVDKNYNNLIFHNNLVRNTISAYDNATHNFWNASVGNYYSDYRGTDKNGDGIGDQPYTIPKGKSKTVDARPLIRPCSTAILDMEALWQALWKYARYDPKEENDMPFRRANGMIVIESKKPQSPPEWPDSQPLIY
jgi:nitrous oxidase accessory protein